MATNPSKRAERLSRRLFTARKAAIQWEREAVQTALERAAGEGLRCNQVAASAKLTTQSTAHHLRTLRREGKALREPDGHWRAA